MAELIHGLDAERVRANLDAVRAEIAAACARAGRDPADVEVLAAVKYVPLDEVGVLADAGITLAGENRAQDLVAKQRAVGRPPDVRLHRAPAEPQGPAGPAARALDPLRRERLRARAARAARDAGDGGPGRGQRRGGGGEERRARRRISTRSWSAAPCRVVGPDDDAAVRRGPRGEPPLVRRAARAGAPSAGCAQLSMGTTQDFAVAVEEGATIVRIGTRLYR